MSETLPVPGVYKAIAAVAGDMARQGIGKTRQNLQQGYKFRGIDEVLNALAPSLVTHGLVILPRCIGRVVTERATKTGGVLIYVVVEAEFDFVAISDGSKHTVKTYGEAMDSGDKATNKAMSAAYKYAAFQAFCIPLEGENDADAVSHEVAPQKSDTAALDAHADDIFSPPQEPPVQSEKKISEAQQRRLFAISKGKPKATPPIPGISHEKLKSLLLAGWGIEHTKEIPVSKYDEIVKVVEDEVRKANLPAAKPEERVLEPKGPPPKEEYVGEVLETFDPSGDGTSGF